MALEDAIQNLANAINRYTDTIGAPQNKEVNTVTSKGETKKNVKATGVEEPVANTPTNDALVDSPEKEVEDKAPDVDVTQLADKFATLIEKDLDAAKGVLTELGFPKLKLVPANLHAKAFQLTLDALSKAEEESNG